MMIKLRKYFLWLMSVIFAAVLILAGGLYYMTDEPGAFIRFCRNFVIVKKYYYRPVSDKELLENATIGMVKSLQDPHSMLISGDKYEHFMQSINAEYVGIGVVIGHTAESKVQILSVFPDSPAEAVGIQSGDIIQSVNGEAMQEMALDAVVGKIKGPIGESVSIVIQRDGENISYEVERAQVSLPTVSGEMLTDDIGYIHIFSFMKHTDSEFDKKLSELKAQGMKKLIIDVRMNPGGIVDTVVAIADKILTKGTVLSFHTKNGEDKIFDIHGVEHVMPMVILIDKNSASASEILAGAIQDKKEGIVIGEKSYGKGTVQSIIPDGDDSVLKISIAEYRTAAGRSIDGKGIEPDVVIEQTGTVFQRTNDNVLQKAIDTLEK